MSILPVLSSLEIVASSISVLAFEELPALHSLTVDSAVVLGSQSLDIREFTIVDSDELQC